MGAPLPRYDKYGRQMEPDLPWLPWAGPEDEPQPSFFVKRAYDSVEYPPLFAKKSWTKGVPHKDTYEFYKPSETIGSSYTPSAAVLRIQHLPPYRKKPAENPLGPTGQLGYPPKKSKLEEEKERKAEEERLKLKCGEVSGLVDVRQLLNGEYWRKKEEERMLLEARRAKRLMRMKAKKEKAAQIVSDRNFEELEAMLPVDPDEQKRIHIQKAEIEMKKEVRLEDLERIRYYVTQGIDENMIPCFCSKFLRIARAKISDKYKKLKQYKAICDTFEPDILSLYSQYMRIFMLKYVLNDPYEWKRLKIHSFPADYPTIIVKAPVPWHIPFTIGKEALYRRLFIGNRIILSIRDLWENEYNDMYILPINQLSENGVLPITPAEFERKVNDLCSDARYVLENVWLQQCANIFLNLKQYWQEFAPKRPGDSTHTIELFFSCVNSLMASQLRRLVMRSLEHFLHLIVQYKDGNDYEGEYRDLAVINIPLLKVIAKPVIGSSDIKLSPTIVELRKLIRRSFTKILEVNYNVPKIENIMFPAFLKNNTFMLSVKEDEEPVMQIIKTGMNSFEANIIGPGKYLTMYSAYHYILNGEAEKWVRTFMGQDPLPLLKDVIRNIEKYEDLKVELTFLRCSIPLGLLSLECSELNDALIKIVNDMRNFVVGFYIDRNRTHNKAICATFDEMSSRVSDTPETVQELVTLQNYVTECRDVTMYNMKEKIRQTAENVTFLMSYAHLSHEDIALNSRTFLWPKDMENVIELAWQRLNMKRDQAENVLKNKRALFDSKLLKHEKQLNIFKKKDPALLTMEEMRDNTEVVETLVQRLQEDKEEAAQINEEEQLLDFDPSPFMNLQKMLATVDPFDRLWHTVLKFHEDYDKWFYGPFKELDADEVKDEVENMWRTLYKLAKVFHDNPGAKRIAEMVRAKVEKFRQFVPVLQTVCNKGLQDRHWAQISEIVGVPLVVDNKSTLNDMIEAGLPKFTPQLEEISASATKEYALEKNLRKMKEEWVDVMFEYDIQLMLDDHILKAQTMRGSPYVKAFEKEMQSWEEKLISMQDILDAWLTCQSTWMYLEPIFGSEDIMRQMPTEARNFKQVDRTWRALMAHTIQDPHVLIATEYLNMLNQLKECNFLLDEIQKGLNNYLEKKRLYFPRFFFLSNDELLEILSETKDPLRVQPHLKKCFEGINLLKFTASEDIVGMISGEGEIVPFSSKITPAEAKGMVEKWLLQVEQTMLQSMKNITSDAVSSYSDNDRREWILTWPGQTVQCVDCVQWTKDVTKAITGGTLVEQLAKCTRQIEGCVQMVQGKLEPGNQITVEALIVIDVHGRDIVKNLLALKIGSIADFNWISQMRYYWEDMLVIVSMITTDVMYGFEYLGNTGRLVATPLTDRCFRTLMGALKLNLGGAPEGPAGTGKTESCKDLAKAVAKKCVVFNCSDGLDYKALGKFFKGLAQAGAWACFDEFNRIELEVLSVVAQQILTIQMAIAAKLERFIFEGTELSLDPTCTIFITMNPG
ncbi:dynein heavy chain family protein [Holotrichia oblita]|uniref:Dynein heavy chain family protein n=1 Tax=Holotrichia oblita TaxID=644536 RepID=A0ACB9SS62_HOLOL|nr:dynein heavy chain family protein [Holotrichia oblita]